MGDVSRTSTPQQQLLPPVAQHYGGRRCHESDGRRMRDDKLHKRNKKNKENKIKENSAVGPSSLTHPPLADLVFDLLKKPRSLGRLEETPTDVSGDES